MTHDTDQVPLLERPCPTCGGTGRVAITRLEIGAYGMQLLEELRDGAGRMANDLPLPPSGYAPTRSQALARLAELGLVMRRRHTVAHGGQPYEYRLTEVGEALRATPEEEPW